MTKNSNLNMAIEKERKERAQELFPKLRKMTEADLDIIYPTWRNPPPKMPKILGILPQHETPISCNTIDFVLDSPAGPIPVEVKGAWGTGHGTGAPRKSQIRVLCKGTREGILIFWDGDKPIAVWAKKYWKGQMSRAQYM